jgi:hypothetical protein
LILIFRDLKKIKVKRSQPSAAPTGIRRGYKSDGDLKDAIAGKPCSYRFEQ